MAPFDPLQLLKALSPLLSADGGIKSPDEVPRLSSLMKKFSKKLVSRCVYCNVLKATNTDVLNVFLDLEGWATLNSWMLDARDNQNDAFMEELLLLCQAVPMTVLRLKQNNTAKLVKTLSKSENPKIKRAARKVVDNWMKLIKGEVPVANNDKNTDGSDKTKKKKPKKEGKDSDDGSNAHGKEGHKGDGKASPKRASAPSLPPVADLDDVEYEPEPPEDTRYKHKEPRPKTVKTLQTRFRSTGLIEETPLPKTVKKNYLPAIDREVVAAVTKKRLNSALAPYPAEKKIKPSSLITPHSDSNGPGIKLIPPKPRPVHVLHESAGFMDALVAVPVLPMRKKKKKVPNSPTTPPPSSAQQPPKLQFYKDTLDMGTSEPKEGDAAVKAKEESPVKESPESSGESSKPSPEESKAAKPAAAKVAVKPEPVAEPVAEPVVEPVKEESPPGPVLRRSMRGKKKLEEEQKKKEDEERKIKEAEEEERKKEEEADKIPEQETDEVVKKEESPKEEDEDSEATQEGDELPMEFQEDDDEEEKKSPSQESQTAEEVDEPGKLKSILMLTRRRDKKKSVRWVEDENIKKFFYFDMDENERVNVNNLRNFGDLKSIEMKRERQQFENARRSHSDKMNEAIPWRPLKPLELVATLIEPGSGSKEKEIQIHKQETTLEEIYFSREMLPDTPHEPDPDMLGPMPQEPILIPIEDISNPGVIMDYSNMDLPEPKAALPTVLASLMMSIATNPFGNNGEEVMPMPPVNEVPMRGGMPPQQVFPNEMPMGAMGAMGAMGGVNLPPPEQFAQMMMPPQEPMGHQGMMPMEMWGGPNPEWGPMGGMPMDHEPGMGMGEVYGQHQDMMGPRGPMGFGGHQQPFQQQMRPRNGPYRMDRGHYNNRRPGNMRGNMRRNQPIMCKHFMSGTCRFGNKCNFLHPGVNGPAL